MSEKYLKLLAQAPLPCPRPVWVLPFAGERGAHGRDEKTVVCDGRAVLWAAGQYVGWHFNHQT